MTVNTIKSSVIMPTYNQCSFIRRAILSLMQQTYKEWELIIINDGCTDETEEYIADYLEDPRVTYIVNKENTGLGHALNQGLDAAKYDYIAYLPSDDYYYANHLETIKEKFEEDENNIFLVYTGVCFKSSDSLISHEITEMKRSIPCFSIQLVQTCHKRNDERWLTRSKYITEDLFQMYWCKLLQYGVFATTDIVTCCWFSHHWQRYRIVSERFGGGLNILRSYYQIKEPIRLKVSKVKFIDEYKLQDRFSGRISLKENHMKILLVGELAYNYDRIYALEQTGHKIYALWTPHPEFSFSAVGPLPFGNIENIPISCWQERLAEIKPNIIYGLLNAGVIPFVYRVVRKLPHIPYIWHFKEGPSICFERGNWDKLIYLYKNASGRIYLNETVKCWFDSFLPKSDTPTLILDGDLPKADYFTNSFSKKISDKDGHIHTLIAGRMIGIDIKGFLLLAKNNIHIHVYNENYYELNTKNISIYKKYAPKFFHVHPHVSADKWTEEFSRYDAGWLHCHKSKNQGDIIRANWDDLNLPARLSTYSAAGIPMIMPENKGHIVASKALTEQLGVGIYFNDYEELIGKLYDEIKNKNHSRKMMNCRLFFSFDYHVSALIEFFNKAQKYKNEKYR